MSKKVYKDGRQFDYVDDLKEAVQEKSSLSQLVSLADSMPRRLLANIEKRGAETKY